MCYAHGVDLLVPPRPRFGVPEFCFSGFSVAPGPIHEECFSSLISRVYLPHAVLCSVLQQSRQAAQYFVSSSWQHARLTSRRGALCSSWVGLPWVVGRL